MFKDRLAAYQRKLTANPQDAAALLGVTKLRFGNASTGENFNQTQGAYTASGLAELRKAAAAWQRYLATNPAKPDTTRTNLMVQAYGPAGLKKYDKAVTSLETVIDSRKEPAASTPSSRSSPRRQAGPATTLAQHKALDLTPKAQRKQLKSTDPPAEDPARPAEQPTQPQSRLSRAAATFRPAPPSSTGRAADS